MIEEREDPAAAIIDTRKTQHGTSELIQLIPHVLISIGLDKVYHYQQQGGNNMQ